MNYNDHKEFNKLDLKKQNLIAWKLLFSKAIRYLAPYLIFLTLVTLIMLIARYSDFLLVYVNYIKSVMIFGVSIIALKFAHTILVNAKEKELKRLKGIGTNGSWIKNTSGKPPVFYRVNAEFKDGSIKWNVKTDSINDLWALDAKNPVIEYMKK